jgi:hypothetical protein
MEQVQFGGRDINTWPFIKYSMVVMLVAADIAVIIIDSVCFTNNPLCRFVANNDLERSLMLVVTYSGSCPALPSVFEHIVEAMAVNVVSYSE